MVRIRISVSDLLARWTRVHAAERGVSTSRLVADILKQEMTRKDDYDRAMKAWFARSRRKNRGPKEQA